MQLHRWSCLGCVPNIVKILLSQCDSVTRNRDFCEYVSIDPCKFIQSFVFKSCFWTNNGYPSVTSGTTADDQILLSFGKVNNLSVHPYKASLWRWSVGTSYSVPMAFRVHFRKRKRRQSLFQTVATLGLLEWKSIRIQSQPLWLKILRFHRFSTDFPQI